MLYFFFFFNKILPVWFYEKDYAILTKPEHVSSTLSVIGEASVRLGIWLHVHWSICDFQH